MRERELITNETFKDMYAKIKGGFFRSTNHIKIFLEENDLIKKAK
jgi:ribosomal protein L19E